MRKYLLILLLFLAANQLFAQGITLRGAVKERGSKFVLPQASLVLQGNDTLRAGTDNVGAFHFSGLKPGKYRLLSAYVSFKTDTLVLELKRDTAVSVFLRSDTRQLTEVVIKSVVPPATIRRDTIAFNTQAYKSRPNAPVEDMLRQLPGVSIDRDGNVTMNGQKVDKILIDGKTFFIDDLRKATRTLPAEIIDQVQVYNTQRDADRDAGNEQLASGSKTINLKLKKNAKQGLVGKFYGGGGTPGVYAAGANLTAFSGRPLFSVDARANNMSDLFTGTESRYAQLNTNRRDLAHLSANYRNEWGKKLSAEIFLNSDHDASRSQGNSLRQTFLPDSTLIQQRGSTDHNDSWRHSLGGRLDFTAKNDVIHYNVNLSRSTTSGQHSDSSLLRTQKNGLDLPLSASHSFNQNGSAQNALNQSLSYVHRFAKKRRSLELALGQSISLQEAFQALNTSLAGNGIAPVRIDQRSQNPVHDRQLNASLAYNEPLGKYDLLQLEYGYNRQSQSSDKRSFDRDSLSGQYTIPDSLTSNHFDSRIITQSLRLRFNGRATEKLRYELAVSGQQAQEYNENYTAAVVLDRIFYNWSPHAGLHYFPGKGRSLFINYDASSQNPSVDQLQPLPDLSNPLLLRLGNPDLRPQFSQRLSANYAAFSAERFTNLQLGMDADLLQHQISLSSVLLPGGVQQMRFINLDGIWHADLHGTYGFPVWGQQHGTASLTGRLSYAHDKALVNGEENANTTPGAGGTFRLNYHDGSRLYIEGSADLGWQSNHYSLPSTEDNATLFQNYALDVAVTLPFSLSAGSRYELQCRQSSGLQVQQSNLLNAWLGMDLNAGHALQARVSAFNLLDAASAVGQFSGPNFTEIHSSTAIGRQLLFSLIYNFKRLGPAPDKS